MPSNLNLLTLTATEIRTRLDAGQTTCVELVNAYLAQIEAHNHKGLRLNALISVAPREKLLQTAHDLDNELKAGKRRSGLHGVPFIVKDVFVTHPDLGMPTTIGGPCFASAKARRTAPILQHLLGMGLILLGKANLTEFCGMKENGNTLGWSPAGGQTQNPYVFGGLEPGEKLIGHSSPGGSSSGTGAGVAAGFACLGIGTECVGSVITPANRAGLYALKIRPDGVDAEGGFGYTDCFDCVGAMAKSAADLSLFVAALMQRPQAFDVSASFEGLHVGFLNPRIWRLNEDVCAWPDDTREQMESAYKNLQSAMTEAGAPVSEVEDLSPASEAFRFDDGKSAFYEVAFYQMPNRFLPKFFNELEESEVRSIEDIIKYNEDHADICLPPEHPKQGEFHDLAANTRTEAGTSKMLADLQSRAKANLEKQFRSCNVIVAFADSELCMYSSAAAVPLDTVKYSAKNERPFGIAAIARTEETLLQFMTAIEACCSLPPRPLPRPLLEDA